MTASEEPQLFPVTQGLDGHVTGVEWLLADASQDSPAFGHILELSALPRTFDENLLATLVEAWPAASVDSFPDAVAWLVHSSFVHERHDGSWALHDRIRGPLLARWHEVRPDDLPVLLGALHRAYVLRFEGACASLVSLAMTEDLLRRVSLPRFLEMSDILEDRLVRAALDAVHTALRISFVEGRTRLIDVKSDLVQRGLYRSCEVLVRGWLSYEGELPDEDRAALRAWGAYCLADAYLASGRPQAALDELDTVGNPEDVDLLFATWHHGLRSGVLRALNRFDDALDALDAEIAIHDQHHVDDVNSSTPWIQKSSLHELLMRRSQQLSAAEAALEYATSLSTPAAQVNARLAVVAAHATTGQDDLAAQHLVAAVQTARLALSDGPDRYVQAANRTVLTTGIQSLGRGSVRLVMAWGEQVRQLSVGDGAGAEIDLLIAQANAVLDAGHAALGDDLYRQARLVVEERLPASRATLDAEEGAAALTMGEPARAAELNLGLLTGMESDALAWDWARWQSNAAVGLLDTGEYHRALALASDAADRWTALGVDHAFCLTKAIEGELHRRLGEHEQADRLLAVAAGVPLEPVLSEHDAYLAQLRFDRADYGAAADHAVRAFETSSSVDPAGDAVRNGLCAVTCLLAAGRTEDARATHAATARLIQSIAAARKWGPSEDSDAADRHAGRALRILVAGYGALEARARSAIEHLEIAVAADDATGWYQAELGWAYTMLGQPKPARKAFRVALERLPTPSLRRALQEEVDEL